MENQFRYSVDMLPRALEEIAKSGVQNVMLFGIPDKKDPSGYGAWIEDGIVQKALQVAKREFPELYYITDVCLCEYTSHGHCGMLKGNDVDNDSTLPLLAKTALSHVQAGADMVAPSDMMDGRIAAIRRELDKNGYENSPIMSYAVKYSSSFYGPFRADMVAPSDMMDGRIAAIRRELDKNGYENSPIMSYAVKYSSSFYGPFREAAGSAPSFGDRKTYQMDYHNRKEAMKEALLDINEGADIIMVKPALSYLDIIRDVANEVNVPVAAYSVSGEYAMIKAAAKMGFVDEENIICETATSIYRSGANILLTYYAKELAQFMKNGRIG